MKKIYYYILSSAHTLLGIVAVLIVPLITVSVCIGINSLFDEKLEIVGKSVGWIVGLLVAGLLVTVVRKIYSHLDSYLHFDKYINSDKVEDLKFEMRKFPYSEKYGADYPKPRPADFDISDAEFKKYNNRFSFEIVRFILLCAVAVLIMYQISESVPFRFILSVAGLGALIYLVMWYIDITITTNHASYYKIKRFQDAHRIHEKIRIENGEKRSEARWRSTKNQDSKTL